jgi:hypothetical protein
MLFILRIQILAILLNFTYLETSPYVTCHLSGQLGNQLHEIATTLGYAWDNHFIPLFPELNRPDSNIDINKKRIFFRLDASSLPRPIANVFNYTTTHFVPAEIPLMPDLLLNGFFQSYLSHEKHRDKLVQIFAPHPDDLSSLHEKYGFLIHHPSSVAIHVRTFNQEWSSAIPFVGLDYYERAMNLFPPDSIFVVFSDRINWCKHHFASFKHHIIYSEYEDHINDFFLMSLLKHNIICNSSFSYWAAYLNQNPQKKVIAPSHFIAPYFTPPHNSNPPEWITLPISFTPYPSDINHYDIRSKSIDTQ